MEHKRIHLVLVLVTFFFAGGCSTGDHAAPPELHQLEPGSKIRHSPAFTLTVSGRFFAADAVIVFDGIIKDTTWIDSTSMSCRIDPEDITPDTDTADDPAAGDYAVPVCVRNSASSGGESNVVWFTVREQHAFSPPVVVPACILNADRLSTPSMVVDADGTAFIACDVAIGEQTGIGFMRARNRGLSWECVGIISDLSHAVRTPHLVRSREGHLFVLVNRDNSPALASSSDQGETWSEFSSLTANCEYLADLSLSVDDAGGLHAIWIDRTADYVPTVCYSLSRDNGNHWTTPVNVYNAGSVETGAFRPRIVVDGPESVYAFWIATYSTKYLQLLFNRSLDGGLEWDLTQRISVVISSADGVIDKAGDIQVVQSKAYIPYMYNMEALRSVDRGETWTDPVPLTDYSTSNFGSAIYPALCVDEASNLNAIFHDDGVRFSRSIDGGQSWSPMVLVSDIDSYSNQYDIDVDQTGTLYMTWASETSGNICFVTSVP